MKKVISWVDKLCKELPKEEQPLCYQLAYYFYDMIADLDKGRERYHITIKKIGKRKKIPTKEVNIMLRRRAPPKLNEIEIFGMVPVNDISSLKETKIMTTSTKLDIA